MIYVIFFIVIGTWAARLTTPEPIIDGRSPSVPTGSAARRLYRLSGPVSAAITVTAGFVIVGLVDPNKPGRYPTCPFLAVTGHWCPGCGSLRAMHALTRGDVSAALGLNVMTVSALPVVAFLWWRWLRRGWSGAQRPAAVHPVYIYLALAAVLAFWVLRNLPIGAALAP